MPSIPIAQIKEGKRYRKDMGDLDRLSDSIRDVGLLQPVVLDPENRLIVGKRRLEAFKKIGHSSIPCVIARNIGDVAQRLRAERDENVCREPLANSEAAALATDLEKRFKPEAEKQLHKSSGRPKKGGQSLPTFSRDESARSESQAARAVGMSRETLRKAKAVVASGKKELIEEMDTTGKVDAVHRKLTGARKPKADGTNKKRPKYYDEFYGQVKKVRAMMNRPWSEISPADVRREIEKLWAVVVHRFGP